RVGGTGRGHTGRRSRRGGGGMRGLAGLRPRSPDHVHRRRPHVPLRSAGMAKGVVQQTASRIRMTDKALRATIRNLTSGIDKLDLVLGGGIPEFSFNVIMGEPGSGKTTLAHQIIFANATKEAPALYFTVLGEPTIKMLRYQQ